MKIPLDASRADAADSAGLVVLSDNGSPYRDGSETALPALLAQASDISSTSEELLPLSEGWAQQYHVDPSRANVLRALDLDRTSRVLEIGAGCGALTRHLGETVAAVDAVEPVVARARVAALRTADQENVRVYAGSLADIPTTDPYDVVIVVGVLEYVGDGSPEHAPYVDFLQGCADRLAADGRLVLAIENKLGVKYLAGAPEDHHGRPYVGVEGYDSAPGLARTFDRAELERLVEQVGLRPTTLVAFPDYKLTRAVLDPRRLTGHAAALLHRVPSFPSPDWVGERATGPDEAALWRSLVAANLAGDTGNSFLVIAGRDEGPGTLWPEGRAARYFSRDRRPRFSVTSTVDTVDGTLVVDKRPTRAEPTGDLWVTPSRQEVVDGEDLGERLRRADEEEARRLILAWRDLLLAAPTQDGVPLDLVPHNLLLSPAGELVLVDDEWRSSSATVDQVLDRGILLTALELARDGRRVRWAPAGSPPSALAALIGDWLGIQAGGRWATAVIEREAAFQAAVLLVQGASGQALADRFRAAITHVFHGRPAPARTQAPVSDLLRRAGAVLDPELRRRLLLGEAALERLAEVESLLAEQVAVLEEERSEHARVQAAHAEAQAARPDPDPERLSRLEAEALDLRQALRTAQQEVEDLRSSTSWRVTAGVRWLGRRVGRDT